ncbi:Mediator of RNA polymerase II transcription subunit 25 [Abeliophyllum distichum]|uniref:Mediator of RNA polymerase II transcription subunit 25 n=1 Tax=Abeliophyllum distichum TaxID=126358 RepID=A0ABD1QZK1_9LAMI
MIFDWIRETDSKYLFSTDGSPDWWLSRAEKIFSMNRLFEAEKVEAAVACLGGEAWAWFQLVDRRRPIQTWEKLKDLMLDRFRVNDVPIGEEFSAGERTPVIA